MKEERWYHILGCFIWQYRMTGVTFLLYIGIFIGIFSLYNLETEAVLYAAALCLLFTAVLLALRFQAYRNRHQERRRILTNVEILLEQLPEPENMEEADYQEMLRKLKTVFDQNLTAWQNERRESMDYYTTWVHIRHAHEPAGGRYGGEQGASGRAVPH